MKEEFNLSEKICKGWIDLSNKKHICNRKINKNNSNEESREIHICRYCLNKMCRDIERCSN